MMTPIQITAKVIAYSRCKRTGRKIATFEFEYPRFIHGELMTHRLFSRNAASSRAIPIKKMIEQVKNNPAFPIHWGKNQAGMQANEELNPVLRKVAIYLWKNAAKLAAGAAEGMDRIGLHKQVVNRVLEPFQIMKTVVTSTCWENWNWLRFHKDAQPEIRELARVAIEALEAYGEPEDLNPGEWHTPYVFHHRDSNGVLQYVGNELQYFTLEEALMISSSCCAQVSFRLLNDDLEKAKEIYGKLVESEPVHASPFEHQATPFEIPKCDYYTDAIWEALSQPGATHMDKNQNIWSGNLLGFAQHRQLIPNNVKQEV
ncbi:thymidylate synthase [Pseudomonas phage vB_PpuM-Amme-3]|uniref:Thymidylate synthase n=1 Tax=Pseudomonas phage vB_PpuM-Amme-3 TaxID=3132617 RepID=A0AAX4MWL0_9CAUD